ncbi:MAG: lysophospholipid acyltransferase family protein [Tannerella sp.]|jgi:KDO2-lipid IV(A) lauroyltransferase|nr:lysophospholipid acyltransferase family protein [Tannerella sp.]
MKFNKKSIRKRMLPILIYPFLGVVIFLFRVLPVKWLRSFAAYVGGHVFRRADRSRETALANLQYVYGNEICREEREAMARQVFTEMMKSFFDYIAYSRLTDKKRFFSLVEVVGEEHLKAAYEQGKGVICLIPHVSSWEFAAITPPMLGYETSAASKALHMKMLEKRMIRFRTRRGMKNITRESSYTKLADVLRKGECLILMIDQDTKVKSVFVDFMGRPAHTPTGASRLALDTGALIVPMVMTRKADDNYRFIIYPELPVTNTGNLEADLIENTQRQTKALEDIIRAYPAQWVWMHSRWRTTPEMMDAYYRGKATVYHTVSREPAS